MARCEPSILYPTHPPCDLVRTVVLAPESWVAGDFKREGKNGDIDRQKCREPRPHAARRWRRYDRQDLFAGDSAGWGSGVAGSAMLNTSVKRSKTLKWVL